ncbi:hypothetical protein GDO81_029950 [Engystomops pustulosus]|uniref:Uncharacterized protein n=1 Tax=Engystomops pustulosus TaxID=76066 RepID=A0AAV6Z3K6_ENGPU|nr:hypothetical protein GDO81_029950 [Engystomops pustulosus]
MLYIILQSDLLSDPHNGQIKEIYNELNIFHLPHPRYTQKDLWPKVPAVCLMWAAEDAGVM